VLAQTGHVPHEERPAQAAGAIVEFLNRLPVVGAR
jgi:pimeloyl-ACP methyl ester carboxylesterase